MAEFAVPAPTAEYADRFLDFTSSLEALLGRRVNVISATALRGSRLAQTIRPARQTIDAEPDPVAV